MGLFDGQAMPEVFSVPDEGDHWSAIALRVEAVAHRAGWHGDDDSPTELFWLREHPVPEGIGFGVAVTHPDVPDYVKAVHPLPLLEMIERTAHNPGKNLLGFVVVVEAWMVVGEAAVLHEQRRRATEVGGEGRLRDHPDRIEIRQAHLITLAGQERVVMRARDGEPMVQVVGREYAGAVPGAMRSLAATLRRRKYGRPG